MQKLREVDVPESDGALSQGYGAKVYISYSRKDAMASDTIGEALSRSGFEVLIDRHDILPGEEWQSRIEQMILSADKVVFLLSPDSANSRVCQREIEIAKRSSKLVVPVLVRETPLNEIPGTIAGLNFVFLRNDDERERGIAALIGALATDIEWVREQTRLNDRAVAWRRGGAKTEFLLRGHSSLPRNGWQPNFQRRRRLARSYRNSSPPAGRPPHGVSAICLGRLYQPQSYQLAWPRSHSSRGRKQ